MQNGRELISGSDFLLNADHASRTGCLNRICRCHVDMPYHNQMADEEAQKELDDLKKQKEKLDAEKAVIDARKALADSQKALDQAQADSAQQKTDLENKKALADELKALADAQNQAALSKYIGDVKAGPYSGTVTMKDKAGTEEALLLGAKAVKEAATKVAEAVASVKSQKIHLFSAKSFPNFQRLIGFRFRKELIQQAFASAGIQKAERLAAEAVTAGLISAGLNAFSDILGFFKNDYEIGNIDTQLDESLLLFSVAGCLGQKPGKEVHLPMLYDPNTEKTLISELGGLVDLRARASSEVNTLKSEVDHAEKAAAQEQSAANKDARLNNVANLKLRIEQLNGAIALYDAFVNSLTTPDPTTGVSPLALIAQEFSIDATLRGGDVVLLLRLENTGGGYLLKKNLLTALFMVPLYHMGGATVTYLLFDAKEGKVLAGDIIPIHGGFVKSCDLKGELQKS
jgi:hypothetical protein